MCIRDSVNGEGAPEKARFARNIRNRRTRKPALDRFREAGRFRQRERAFAGRDEALEMCIRDRYTRAWQR